ncbi:MAG TPA: hypothetical protein VM891_12305, partial [Amaricoccus sp.]|nr:hypothetical protein [Amaricoccus sp.]
MRRSLALALAFFAAACSDEGLNPIVDAAVKEVNPLDNAAAPATQGAQITRAAVNRADVATIRARLVDDKSPTYLLAAANNGGYITYASALRQTVPLPVSTRCRFSNVPVGPVQVSLISIPRWRSSRMVISRTSPA